MYWFVLLFNMFSIEVTLDIYTTYYLPTPNLSRLPFYYFHVLITYLRISPTNKRKDFDPLGCIYKCRSATKLFILAKAKDIFCFVCCYWLTIQKMNEDTELHIWPIPRRLDCRYNHKCRHPEYQISSKSVEQFNRRNTGKPCGRKNMTCVSIGFTKG
jgi:hypothetical protein